MQFQQHILSSLFFFFFLPLPKSILCLQQVHVLCVYRSCWPQTAISTDMTGGQQRALFWWMLHDVVWQRWEICIQYKINSVSCSFGIVLFFLHRDQNKEPVSVI